MLRGDDLLNKLVVCPHCKKETVYAEMIWLDGECLCPRCYQNKRDTYDNLIQFGYDKAKKENM